MPLRSPTQFPRSGNLARRDPARPLLSWPRCRGTIREVGGVFGVAVLAAIFTANGDDGSPAAYVAGLQPAIAVGAVVVGIGALAALFIPAGAGARATVTQPAEPRVEAGGPVGEPA
jgi:hypothetical protein